MTNQRTAIVTGANRGIGFEVCRQLAALGLRVVLTSRDAAKGDAAVAKLAASGLTVTARELDVTREASIAALAEWLEREFGGVDVLVNNAGILDSGSGTRVLNTSAETLRNVLATNIEGPFLMCKALVPLMRRRQYGRVVNLSSGLGQLSDMGAGTPAYRVSKAALNALTRTLAAEVGGTNILVNSACPGWVRTDMGGPNATRSVEQGAETVVWLATLPDDGPTGGFFRDCKPISW